MSSIVIVGAGSGLGRAVAARFAKEGFDVGLVSRTKSKLEPLVEQLVAQGADAEAFPADVTDRAGLAAALADAEARFGQIDVLQFSPAPVAEQDTALGPVDALQMTVADVQPQIDFYLYGAMTAIGQVLPGMLERGSGTLLVSTGASSGPVQHPPFGNIAAASGALRNWVLNLHEALGPRGIYAAHVAIAAWIGQGGPETQPETIAEVFWDLHQTRAEPERFYNAM